MTLLFAYTTAVTTSVIAAAASIVAALITVVLGQRITQRNAAQLELLRAELAGSQAEQDAQRDYRYEAIKRLYTDFQPLLFQLSELCDSAYKHTRALARTARNGHLGAGEASWLDNDEYFLISTMYWLLAPVAVIRLMARRLTLVDLSVDRDVREQYRFARVLVGTWNGGFNLASMQPKLEYEPHEPDAAERAATTPAVYMLQHLFAGQVDQIAGGLIAQDPDGSLRHRTYGEFEEAYRSNEKLRDVFAPARRLLQTFHPRTHPVLWRMLITQAHLHRAIARTFVEDPGVIVSPSAAITDDERRAFDWREPDAPETEEMALDAPFQAARSYLESALGSL